MRDTLAVPLGTLEGYLPDPLAARSCVTEFCGKGWTLLLKQL